MFLFILGVINNIVPTFSSQIKFLQAVSDLRASSFPKSIRKSNMYVSSYLPFVYNLIHIGYGI